MKLVPTNFHLFLFVGLALLLLCGLYSSTTTALPLSSLARNRTDSISLDVRAASIGSFTKFNSIPRALIKRGAIIHTVVIILVLLLVVALICIGVWWLMKRRGAI
jgi:hypothetical protein